MAVQILRRYHAYRVRRAVNVNELEQAATMAEAHQMQGLQAEALYVRSLADTDQQVAAQCAERAELLALELNYRALPVLFPSRGH